MLLLLFLRFCETFIRSIVIFKSILNKQGSLMNIQLSFSCSLVTNRSILLGVLEQVVRSRRGCTFLEDNCDCEHEDEYRKIRMVCTGNRKGGNSFGMRLWLGDDLITCGMLSSELYHIIIIEGAEYNIDFGQCKNVISIVDLNELGGILTKSIFELQKRGKMQYMLRRTHRKYEENQSKFRLCKLFQNYIQTYLSKSLKALKSSILFHQKIKLALFQKYFNAWRILTLEGCLSSLNEEIVSKQMLLEGENRRLIARCFKGWKSSKQKEEDVI